MLQKKIPLINNLSKASLFLTLLWLCVPVWAQTDPQATPAPTQDVLQDIEQSINTVRAQDEERKTVERTLALAQEKLQNLKVLEQTYARVLHELEQTKKSASAFKQEAEVLKTELKEQTSGLRVQMNKQSKQFQTLQAQFKQTQNERDQLKKILDTELNQKTESQAAWQAKEAEWKQLSQQLEERLKDQSEGLQKARVKLEASQEGSQKQLMQLEAKLDTKEQLVLELQKHIQSTKDEAKQLNQKLQDEVAQLQNEVYAQQIKFQEQVSQTQAIHTELAETKTNREESLAQLSEMYQNLKTAQDELQQTAKQLHSERASKEALELAVTDLQETVDRLAQDNAQSSTYRKTVQSQLEVLAKDNERYLGTIETLTNQVEEHKAERDALWDQLKNTYAELNATEEAKSNLREMLEAELKTRQDLSGKVEHLQETLAYLKQDNMRLSQEDQQAKKSYIESQQQYQKLEAKLEAAQQLTQASMESVKTKDLAINELKLAHSDKDKLIKELNQKVNTLSIQHQEQANLAASMEKQNTKLAAEKDQYKEQLAQLQGEYSKQRDQLNAVMAQETGYQRQLRDLQTALDQERTKKDSLAEHIEAYKSKATEMQNVAESARAELKQMAEAHKKTIAEHEQKQMVLLDKNKEYEQDVKLWQSKVSAADEKQVQLNEEFEMAQEQLAGLHRKIKEMAAEKQALRLEIGSLRRSESFYKERQAKLDYYEKEVEAGQEREKRLSESLANLQEINTDLTQQLEKQMTFAMKRENELVKQKIDQTVAVDSYSIKSELEQTNFNSLSTHSIFAVDSFNGMLVLDLSKVPWARLGVALSVESDQKGSYEMMVNKLYGVGMAILQLKKKQPLPFDVGEMVKVRPL